MLIFGGIRVFTFLLIQVLGVAVKLSPFEAILIIKKRIL